MSSELLSCFLNKKTVGANFWVNKGLPHTSPLYVHIGITTLLNKSSGIFIFLA